MVPGEGDFAGRMGDPDEDPEEEGEDEGPSSAWLPPDDRLWRHPSEIASAGPPLHPGGGERADAAGGARPWGRLAGAGAAGALLAVSAVLLAAHLSSPARQAVATDASATGASRSEVIRTGKGVMALAARVHPAMVAVVAATPSGPRRGSGFIYTPDGIVLTTYGLVAGSSGVNVTTSAGQEQGATILGTDAVTDLAVLQIDGHGLPTAQLGDSSSLKVGEITMAVSTGGSDENPTVQPYLGTVERLGSLVRSNPPLLDAVETDVPLSDAWAPGGVMLDSTGAVVAMVDFTTGSGAQTTCMATPINLVRAAADQVARTGYASHSWLGITGESVKGPPAGVRVLDVEPGGPAAASGVQAGDTIVGVGQRRVSDMDDLWAAIRFLDPGTVVQLSLVHHGSPETVATAVQTEPAGE
jgi:putative serine protease PepD